MLHISDAWITLLTTRDKCWDWIPLLIACLGIFLNPTGLRPISKSHLNVVVDLVILVFRGLQTALNCVWHYTSTLEPSSSPNVLEPSLDYFLALAILRALTLVVIALGLQRRYDAEILVAYAVESLSARTLRLKTNWVKTKD